MSTTNVKTKRKLPKQFNHKALPKTPQRSLPKTPNKDKAPRSISFKRSENNEASHAPNDEIQTRNNRAQTFSHTEQSNDGTTTMTYTYTTTYQIKSNQPQRNNSRPPPETYITFGNGNLPRAKSVQSQPQTVITFTTGNQNQNHNNNSHSKPETVITFTAPTTTTRRKRAQSSHKPQTSCHKILPLGPAIRNTEMEYCYLDNVILNDNRQGTIKYIGEISIDLKGEIWYGIQLTDARGQNNGSLRGQKYFECPIKHGTFVEKKNIRWLSINDSDDEIDFNSSDRFHISEIVRIINKKGKAQIRCICEINKQLKYGIELFNDMGSHSGIVNGKFYFTCGFYKGLFVDKKELISLKNGDPIQDEKKHKIKQSIQLDIINTNNNINDDDAYDDEHSDHDEYDSDASDESISSAGDATTNFFDQIELNEEDENMMFSHILNKLKTDGRNMEQSDSDSQNDSEYEIKQDEKNEQEYEYEDDDTKLSFTPTISVPRITADHSVESAPSLCASETSPASNIFAGTGAASPYPDIENKSKSDEVAIIMTNHKHKHPENNLSIVLQHNTNIIEPVQELKLPVGSKIIPSIATHTSPMSTLSTPDSNNTNISNNMLSPMLSPLQTPIIGGNSNINNGLQTPLSVEQLNIEFQKYNKDNCHLKEFPDSPFDINTTRREFNNCALTIQLGCNNPHKLFKILHAMVGKLYLNTMKYRSLNLNSSKIKTKLLQYEGVDEFFNLLGFEQHDSKLECDLYQPPLSVLKDAINIITKFIDKTGRKRGIVDMIKKFQTINLDELKTDIIDAENTRDTPNKIATPTGQINSFSAMVEKRNINIIHEENKEEIARKEIQKMERIIKEVYTPHVDDDYIDDDDDDEPEPQPNEPQLDKIEEEVVVEEDEEEEEEDDHFKLGDIINSITHPQNTDSSAISIVLLCYPLFSKAGELFKCLKKRFLLNDKQFIIQKKVIGFINEWINKYWQQDWILNDELSQVFDEFVDIIIDTKTDNKYQEIVDYLLDIQTKQSQKKNKILKNILNNKYGFDRILNNLNGKKNNIICEKLFEKYSIKFDQFFKLNNNSICKQIIILDFEYFNMIKSRECVGQSWKKKNKYEIAEGICNCIDSFNRITLWVQTRILLCDTIKKRSKLIKKFIKICEILFSLRNFQSLYSIYAGLNSSAIIRLKKSWNCVATKHLAKFEEFKVIFSSKKNMANLRKLHRETYPPMIPYLGIYLQDLFQIEEGNSKTKEDGTINFNILIRLTNVIDQMLKYQKYKFNNLKINKNIQKILVNEFKLNQNLNENTIWKLSDKAKKIDDKKRLFRK